MSGIEIILLSVSLILNTLVILIILWMNMYQLHLLETLNRRITALQSNHKVKGNDAKLKED